MAKEIKYVEEKSGEEDTEEDRGWHNREWHVKIGCD